MATALAPAPQSDHQVDFSGGANPFRHSLLLAENECRQLTNTFSRLGGGLESRKGFKLYNPGGASQGTGIFEMEQSTGTVLTHVSIGSNYYDETMWPRYRLFTQTPGINDAAYFGAREPFYQLVLYLIYAYVPAAATQGLVYEYWDGANWTDITASVSESVANGKKLAAAGEVVLSWGALTSWTPRQVETRGYQYWLRIRVTVDVQNGGSDVVVGQRRVRGDWVGRRHLMTTDTTVLWEWPGFTVAHQSVEAFPGVQRIPRVNRAMMNEHLYYALDGQSALRRWNGSRGVTRAGGSNNPSTAGLYAPTTAPVLTQPTANPNAYPVGYTIRYRVAFEHGPEGMLGESLPSASAEIVVAGAAKNLRVDFSAHVTAAATRAISAILIYATYDVTGKVASQRDFMGGFLLVKRVLRDDADWNTTYWEDPFQARLQKSPIAYDNTPPFYPKYLAVGAHRLWMANETTVAASDIERGDSWNPDYQFFFAGGVKGIIYHGERLYVFHGDDISFIEGINEGLPRRGYFWRGIGLAQPDTLCVWNDEIHFVSPYGPARIFQRAVQLTAKGRVWEKAPYWAGVAAQRRIASAVAHEGRIWFGIDSVGAGPALTGMATLDMLASDRGAWSNHVYGTIASWGALGVVHAPLDHALARQLILCAFPDGSYTADYQKLAILEYGTTDNWTTVATDGTKITSTFLSRSLATKGADRWKRFLWLHIRHHLKATGAGVQLSATFKGEMGRVDSKTLTQAGTASDVDQDWITRPTEIAGGGSFRDTTPSLELVAASDNGWILSNWILKAELEPEKAA